MASGPDLVLDELKKVGFKPLPKPLNIAGSTFDFDAAAVGGETSHDLVVIATHDLDPRRLNRLLSGLVRTLDQVKSKRPISLILLGSSLPVHEAADLERFARVLITPGPEPTADEIKQAIAVLTPLELPAVNSRATDPLVAVADRLATPLPAEQRTFLDAARTGADAVREQLRRYIEESFLLESVSEEEK